MTFTWTSLLVCLFSTVALQAQITLSGSTHLPQTGDTVRYRVYSTSSAMYFSAGANQNWVLTGASMSDPVATNYQAIPITTTDGNLHTTATVAGVNLDTDSAITYNQITGGDHFLTGTLTKTGRIVYSDPGLYMRYPISYQDVHTDLFAGAGTTFTSTGPFNYRRGGQSKVEATGYGSLQMPAGTVYDVLQVTYTAMYGDTMPGGTTAFGEYRDTIRMWYSAQAQYPIATYTKGYIVQFGTPVRYSSFVYHSDVSAIVSAQRIAPSFADLHLFPNPATDRLTVQGVPSGSSLRVVNAQGQVVHERAQLSTDAYELSTDEWPSGVYWLTVTHEAEHRTQLFVVE